MGPVDNSNFIAPPPPAELSSGTDTRGDQKICELMTGFFQRLESNLNGRLDILSDRISRIEDSVQQIHFARAWLLKTGCDFAGPYNTEGQPHGEGVARKGQCKYVGSFYNGLKHGYGVLTNKDGFRYEGGFERDKYHGFGKITMKDGYYYEGGFIEGEHHGKGQIHITCSTGDVWQGECLDGVPFGCGILKYLSGNTYDGTVESWLPHGSGKMTYTNKDVYEGAFQFGKRHGDGVLTNPNGFHYVGGFEDDKFHGQAKVVFGNGGEYIGSYANGLFHGYGKRRYSNGDVFTGEFKSGKFHGPGVYESVNGRRMEAVFDQSDSTASEFKIRGQINFTTSQGDHLSFYSSVWLLYYSNVPWLNAFDSNDPKATLTKKNGDKFEGIFRGGQIFQGVATLRVATLPFPNSTYIGEVRSPLSFSHKSDRKRHVGKKFVKHGKADLITNDGARYIQHWEHDVLVKSTPYSMTAVLLELV